MGGWSFVYKSRVLQELKLRLFIVTELSVNLLQFLLFLSLKMVKMLISTLAVLAAAQLILLSATGKLHSTTKVIIYFSLPLQLLNQQQ